MFVKLGLSVLFACLLAISRGDDPAQNIVPQPANASTESPPTPPASTPTPPTSSTPTPPTSSTPTPPTSSTPTPPTSSTLTPPTSSTTSTTAAAPTSTVPPSSTAVPPPTVGKWRVWDSNNVSCIMADMAIQVDVILDANKTEHLIFDVPSNAVAENTTQCGNTTQSLVLTWSPNSSLVMMFTLNDTKFVLSQVVLNTTINSTVVVFKNNETEFATPVSKSYRCSKEQEIKLNEDEKKAVLKISQVQWEAFHKKTDDNFSAAEDCASSTSPDIVPIAVGCALVGLVAIVLIAYLVGRRRSQARGYLSM